MAYLAAFLASMDMLMYGYVVHGNLQGASTMVQAAEAAKAACMQEYACTRPLPTWKSLMEIELVVGMSEEGTSE